MDNSDVATVEGESRDWINDLPDCILSSILSLLRIKDAAQTSIVCRRWRNLWKTARPSNLELDIANILGSEYAAVVARCERYHTFTCMEPQFESFDRQCYIERVNEVLEVCSCNKLDSLKVAFFLDREDTQVLDKWVRFAITKGAQKLDLRLFEADRDNSYAFPHWILADLNVSTLKHLSLYRCVLQPPSAFDRFMQLTTLHLNEVKVDPDFLKHLFSACVLLESLTLKSCRVRTNLIVGPSVHLQDLRVLLSYNLERIEIDAVNLSYFEYDGYRTSVSFMRTPKLVSFFFRGWHYRPLLPNVLTQLTSCPELSTLHLHISDEFEVEFKNIPQNFPTLRNLKQVKLDLLMADFELGSVLRILRAAPILEELIMTLQAQNYHGEMSNLSTISLDHLRRVKLQCFQGKWFEIEFAISILKIATKLEEIVIDPLGLLYSGDGLWIEMICSYEDGFEDEHEHEHELLADDLSEDEDDGSYQLYRWQRRGRAAVQKRLKDVKTDAQVIIL